MCFKIQQKRTTRKRQRDQRRRESGSGFFAGLKTLRPRLGYNVRVLSEKFESQKKKKWRRAPPGEREKTVHSWQQWELERVCLSVWLCVLEFRVQWCNSAPFWPYWELQRYKIVRNWKDLKTKYCSKIPHGLCKNSLEYLQLCSISQSKMGLET